ncbi:MAG: hypothetical protein OEZ65_07005 [Gemmatimonadota bacterium]|nr:hypothetical protein [Gemmatimonadota bacterium]MDH5759321.1 hypothetical protein [Gemmatimonadota bacterium]
MQLLMAVVCDDAQLNPEGKLDVRGVFNDLYAPGFPAKQDHMVLVLVVEWDRDDEGRHQFRVDLEDDAGKPTLSVEGYSDVDRRPANRPPPRTRLVMPLEDVVFPQAGGYTFQVKIKGRTLRGPSLYLVESETAPSVE